MNPHALWRFAYLILGVFCLCGGCVVLHERDAFGIIAMLLGAFLLYCYDNTQNNPKP